MLHVSLVYHTGHSSEYGPCGKGVIARQMFVVRLWDQTCCEGSAGLQVFVDNP
jgi:hypothetical protein